MINLYLELIFDYGLAEALFLNAEVCIFMQGLGPYSTSIKKAEKEIKDMAKKVNDLCGMKIFTWLFALCCSHYCSFGFTDSLLNRYQGV